MAMGALADGGGQRGCRYKHTSYEIVEEVMGDLVERLNEEGLGFGIGPALLCQEAAAEITRLRAALADAQAVGFAAGVEAAAKVAVAQAVYTRETIERATGSELVSNLVTVTKSKTAHDIETAIRALTPPDLTAAAARVLLGDENALRKLTFAYDREDAAQRGEPNPHTFIDLDAPDMGASWVNERIGCAVSALRAIAGDTP